MIKASKFAAPCVLALAVLGGCSSTASESAAPSSSTRSTEATDPGVRAYHGRVIDNVTSVDDASEHITILGTVQRESHGSPSGEIDSFMTVRSIVVSVDEVLNGSLADSSVTVENGVYEWRNSGDTDTANAERYTQPGQPWLKPGESAVLVLKKVSASTGNQQAEFHSFGEAGTYRVTDGKLAATPRTPDLLSAPGLPHELVGDTPEQVEAKL